MTKVERTCPRCGLVFASDKLDDLCPGCLLTNTLDMADGDDLSAFWEEEPATTALGRSFSHFEIMEELGRGGMGTVYKARDHTTERIVALKVLQAHHLSEPDLVQRFRAEVRAISSLDHRYILPIHEVGENDGIPFFSMKLATGGSLAHRLGDYLGRPRPAAQLLAKIARGVQHAHEHGILHRDLKPGNILLDNAGEPYVGDFGLAKWMEDDRRLTITSAVLGTPHYIAPEQAAGSQGLTIAADIYSLGAIFYELLTGRPPFVGETVIDTLRQASENTPAKPSSIVNQTPRDLETICLKALEREPGARYHTAAALADDLDNWLAGRPIRARPVTAAEQLWRWARRNPLPAILGATLVLALVALAIGATIAAVKIGHSRARAVAAELDAREQLYSALLAQARASRMSGQAGHRVEALAAIKKAAAIQPSLELRNEAIAALTLIDLQVLKKIKVRERPGLAIAYDAIFETVAVGTEDGDIKIVNLRDGKTIKTINGIGKPLYWQIHSGSRFLASRGDDGIVYIRELSTGKLIGRYEGHRSQRSPINLKADCAFSADERLLALSTPEGIKIIEITTGKEVARWLTEQPALLAFDPAGGRLAFTAERTLRIWNYGQDHSISEITLSSDPTTIAWSPDSTKLAIGYNDFSVHVLRAYDWQKTGILTGHRSPITTTSFNSSGDILATTADDGTIRLWDIRTMNELVELPKHGGRSALAFSPNNRCLGTATEEFAVILEIVGTERVCTAFAPPSSKERIFRATSTMDFSPDSRLLATASTTTIQFFDAQKGELLCSLPIDPETQTTLRFMPDGNTLAVLPRKMGLTFYQYTFHDGKLDLKPAQSSGRYAGYVFGSLSYASSDPFCLYSDQEPKGILLDASLEKTICEFKMETAAIDLVVNPDVTWIATSYYERNTQISSVPSGEPIATLDGGKGGTLVFSPSGRWLALSGKGVDYLLWNTQTWKKGPSLPSQVEIDTGRFAFSRDENFLAASMIDQIGLISLVDNTLVGMLEQHLYPYTRSHLRFSPDGSLLAAQSSDNSLCLWKIEDLKQQLSTLNLHW